MVRQGRKPSVYSYDSLVIYSVRTHGSRPNTGGIQLLNVRSKERVQCFGKTKWERRPFASNWPNVRTSHSRTATEKKRRCTNLLKQGMDNQHPLSQAFHYINTCRGVSHHGPIANSANGNFQRTKQQRRVDFVNPDKRCRRTTHSCVQGLRKKLPCCRVAVAVRDTSLIVHII